MPYLYKTSIETCKSGIPTMRSMVLEFTEDKTCHFLDKQYMLGENLLVAPIFNEESMAEYYLPKGTWTNYFTGEVKTGGTWVNEAHDYLSIPLFVKENSMICTGAVETKPDYDYEDHCMVSIYALGEGSSVSDSVYSMKNQVALRVTAKKEQGNITITTNGEKEFTICLVNEKASSVQGGTMVLSDNNTIITPSNLTGEIVVTI